jgi:hypothetical protein
MAHGRQKKIISKVAVQQVGHCIMARNYGKISVLNLTNGI